MFMNYIAGALQKYLIIVYAYKDITLKYWTRSFNERVEFYVIWLIMKVSLFMYIKLEVCQVDSNN